MATVLEIPLLAGQCPWCHAIGLDQVMIYRPFCNGRCYYAHKEAVKEGLFDD